MPLKYWAGLPLAVTIVGSVHGGLFILYLLVLAYATFSVKWPLKWPGNCLDRQTISATI